MRFRFSLRPLAGLFAVLLSAGLSAPALAAMVQPGVPFGLRLGGEAEIAATGVIVRFSEVLEDSRCPINALCVWSGVLRIALTVSAGVRDTNDIAVDTLGATAEAGGYQFSLLVAKPSRLADVPIAPEDYGVLILAVETTDCCRLDVPPGK